MSVVYRTADAPAEIRADYWRQVVARLPVRLEGGPSPGAAFRAEVVAGRIGSVHVARMSMFPGECRRSARLARTCDADSYQLDVLAEGAVTVEQGGRQARLAPGDVTLLDPGRPVRYVHSATRHVNVVFPRSMLPHRPGELERLTAVRVPGRAGIGGLLSSVARRLPDCLDACDSADAVRLGAAVVDLLTAALATRLDSPSVVPPEARQEVLVRRIHRYVEEHLGDPALAPAAIAEAHHISVRYLHKLFQARGSTVADWVRQRRLDRCRRDLLDPALRDRPVNAVGARWGFPTAAGFNRVFKASHGVPPGEYRAGVHGRPM
ncbi:helix-turn-helix domain-containing protein [Actinoplanes sp. NPDC051513]|uniref:AraC-like ligand-binding domain-containing protein n=1 Tax=Actinoplanes sp. NPDC051513 TaxID=3363908 RepID=UPI0037956C65